jgi:hypothetical protein
MRDSGSGRAPSADGVARQRNVSRDARLSRNSTGAKESEFLAPREGDDVDEGAKAESNNTLLIYFALMVFVGLGNKIFNKLETIPMYNYPNFLNLLTTAVFVPCCFAYIIPAARKGWIPKEQLEMPRKPFAVMGGLDAMAGIMQVFSATYLPGPLLILLSQAAIPISMVISKYMLNAEYNKFQYAGALVVAGGIMVVLAPTLSGEGDVLWTIIMIASTVPMTLSSVYKEIALGETELDAMYLNGWIAVFQFLFSFPLMIPAALASSPPVAIPDLPENLWNGLRCFMGYDSIHHCDDDGDDCQEDNCMPQAPMFVCCYLVFNQAYNLLILLILKHGSANILWLSFTLMVPLGNVAFTLNFIPEHAPLRITDIIGLVVIVGGLGMYRFAYDMWTNYQTGKNGERKSSHQSDGSKKPLLDLLLDAEDIIDSTTEGGNSTDNTSASEATNPLVLEDSPNKKSRKKSRSNSKNSRNSGGSDQLL